MRFRVIVAVCALLALSGLTPATAQPISTADLAGDWAMFQLATPPAAFTAPAVRSYRGTLTFDATGVVTGSLTDNAQPLASTFAVSGELALTAAGLVSGTLSLDDGVATSGSLEVAGARLLQNRNTIVGASTVLASPGLFTLVKLAPTPFVLNTDLAGDWNYHEITPSHNLAAGDATSVRGSITFHENNGCTEADLQLADGTVRAARDADPQSFG